MTIAAFRLPILTTRFISTKRANRLPDFPVPARPAGTAQ